jgi:hypothetical protein
MTTVGTPEYVEEAAETLARQTFDDFFAEHHDEIITVINPYIGKNEVMESLSANSLISVGTGRSQGVRKKIAQMGIAHKLMLGGRIKDAGKFLLRRKFAK